MSTTQPIADETNPEALDDRHNNVANYMVESYWSDSQ